MSASIYRRCGCRTASGAPYAPLPERPTETQKAAACPTLLRDPKHGSWGFAVSGGNHPGTGRRVQVRKMGFATKKAAQQARAKVVDEIATGRFKPDRKITVGDYLAGWLLRRERDGMRASTLQMYRKYVRDDITPSIGSTKLAELRRFHVDQMVRSLIESGRGTTTIRRIHATLSSALTDAQRIDLVDMNVASKIALPSATRKKLEIWEPDQVRIFLDLVTEHRIGAAFELAVFTGMRRGELAGLRWADVNLSGREVIVRQQRVQVGKTVVEGAVKTDAGQDRRVSLGGEAVGALIAWKLRQDAERTAWGAAYVDSGYVFTRADGTPLRPAYLSRVFETLTEKTDLPPSKLHGLRHVHASLLLSAGIPTAVVSKRLGHATIAITSDLYSHLLVDANRAAADAAESMLPPSTIRGAHTLHTQ